MDIQAAFKNFYYKNKNKEFFWFTLSILCSLLICFLIQNVYIRITGVIGDQQYYMGLLGESKSGAWFLTRTGFTFLLYKIIRSIFGIYFATYILPIISSIIIFKLIYPYWQYISKRVFIISIFLPHYWVWQSISSKESITIIMAFLVCYFCAKSIYTKIGFKVNTILAFSFLTIAFYRIHYSISYFWIYSSSLLVIPKLNKDLIKNLKIRHYFALLITVTLIFIVIFFIIFNKSTINLIHLIFDEGSNYFTLSKVANTTRWDVEYKSISDIVRNLYWGIPFSIIGFTPSEVFENKKYIFSLIEGLISFLLIFLTNFEVFQKSKKDPKLRFVYFYILLPATLVAYIAHYPFGIFNPGTSIRFKQNISSILYFYPIFLVMFSRYNDKRIEEIKKSAN
tara:strand:+ start:3855 stop:5039 length:1185 start_codon:yes stop_codon:yes gene_type:complete